MVEPNKEPKVEAMVAVAGKNPFPQDQTLITNIQASKEKGLQTYEVYYLVPTNDEQCQKQYNCSLKDLITQGVRNLSTRPNYQLEFVDGKLTPAAHVACQKLADGYKCGVQRTSVNREMKELKTMASEAGISIADVKAMILAKKNKGVCKRIFFASKVKAAT